MRIPQIIFIIALLFASFTDIKTRKIKIWTFPIAAAISIPFTIHYLNSVPTDIKWYILDMVLGLIIGFGAFFCLAYIGHGGGGDAIMCGLIGLIFGLTTLAETIIIASIIEIIAMLVIFVLNKRRDKKLTYRVPLAPFIAIAFIIDCIFWG